MPSRLATLLREPEEVIGSIVSSLEGLSGFESQDIRLLDENAQLARVKTTQLGLDGQDSTGHEIYHSLQAKFSDDSQKFATALGLSSGGSAVDQAKTIASLAELAGASTEVWGLKQAKAKAMLRAEPPKALMKKLGYRSCESMLKHEDVSLLYGALSLAQSQSWLDSFWLHHSKLGPMDFENRKLSIIVPETQKWQALESSTNSILSVAQLGSVIIWPSALKSTASGLATLVLTLKVCESTHLRCLIAKAQQVHSEFGSNLISIWKNDLPHIATLANQPLQWRTILHFFGDLPEHLHPEAFEPHILPSNLRREKTEDKLAKLHPTLNWWRDIGFVLGGDGKSKTSFNIADVALANANGLAYKNRSLKFARQSLWDELIARYMHFPAVLQKIEDELDDNLLPKSIIRVPALEFEPVNYNSKLVTV